jgi:hypothetical protein
MTTPLHLRKVMIVRDPLGEQKSVKNALAPFGSSSPLHGKVSWRVAFWVPLPPGHAKRTRNVNRRSIVPDVRDFELDAIRDGAIEEVVLEVDLAADTPDHFRERIMLEAWERLAKHRLGGVSPVRPEAPVIVSGEIAAREFERRKLVV